MSDKMTPISFKNLLRWVRAEYQQHQTVFGLPEQKFYRKTNDRFMRIFGETLDTPVGPAAGPHTQLAQNIITAYLSGSRFFELKSVQIMDELEFPKPCISAEDEGYNTEWSTELSIMGAFDEYVKAWFVLHVLQKELFNLSERRFVFNMSVGYDLKGIQSPKVDQFVEGLKDASQTAIFQECLAVLSEELGSFAQVDREFVAQISPHICSSITLSTMHGCPPAEIEAIIKYLLGEKRLHTFVKMNPTLLSYEYVKNTFAKLGYNYIELKEESFTHDLQFGEGVEMLKRLQAFALEKQKDFGVKMSNTLPVKIMKSELPGDEMYLSGRALYPLTINLAFKLASAFEGNLKISYSGGADAFNLERIFATGIRPITVATTLLKPGGYQRFKQLAELLDSQLDNQESTKLDLVKLQELAASSLEDANYLKAKRATISRKLDRQLPLMDCFIAPCAVGCPIEQDIPEYIRLVGEKRYEEALAVIVSKNPLPFITGTICYHHCMKKCTRLDYEESVQIRGQKLIAAQKGYAGLMQKVSVPEPQALVKIAVIGAGPAGLSAAYFLAKAGLEVTVFEQREKAGGTVEYLIPESKIPRESIAKDVELIRKTGVKFKFGIDPNFSLAAYWAQGFHYVFLALGAGKVNPLNDDRLRNNGIALGEMGKIIVNQETLETSVENVFVGGDILAGPRSVVGAIAQGTKVAKAILAKEKLEFRQEFSTQISFTQAQQLLEIAEKKGVMKPVGAAEQEASRCLECNKVCDICVEVCPNRANLMIPVQGQGLTNLNQILHLDGMCNECGNCATFCPYSSEPYKVKWTLFWGEKEFQESTNSGFLIVEEGAETVVWLRHGGEVSKVKFDKAGQTDVPIEGLVAALVRTIINQYPYLYRA
ncbi:MAG: putative selenate reductase subunit YgfK [Desulfosporosinus sp.]|nr:putative selenate reductase subunit YgfK [Desulfosporosinus sp.]